MSPLGIGLAAPCLVFVLAGKLAKRLRVPGFVGPLLLAVCALVVAFAPIATVNLKAANFGTPLVGVIVSTGICWGLALTFAHVQLPLGAHSIVTAFAATGIAVVLSHTLVITVMQAFEVQSKLTLIVALIVPWGTALLLRASPLSIVAIGAHQNARSGRFSRATSNE